MNAKDCSRLQHNSPSNKKDEKKPSKKNPKVCRDRAVIKWQQIRKAYPTPQAYKSQKAKGIDCSSCRYKGNRKYTACFHNLHYCKLLRRRLFLFGAHNYRAHGVLCPFDHSLFYSIYKITNIQAKDGGIPLCRQ